eukprot:COSAG03_NODE_2260_length_2947_cov_3.757022_4_plen_161_part_00
MVSVSLESASAGTEPGLGSSELSTQRAIFHANPGHGTHARACVRGSNHHLKSFKTISVVIDGVGYLLTIQLKMVDPTAQLLLSHSVAAAWLHWASVPTPCNTSALCCSFTVCTHLSLDALLLDSYETVLPGSALYNTSDASANNVVFALVPQNLSAFKPV